MAGRIIVAKYFIVAGTHDQFVAWKKRNHPEMLINGQIQNLSDIVYVSGAEALKGYSNPTGLFIGTWYKRSNITQIIDQLTIAGMPLDTRKKLVDIYNHSREVVNEKEKQLQE